MRKKTGLLLFLFFLVSASLHAWSAGDMVQIVSVQYTSTYSRTITTEENALETIYSSSWDKGELSAGIQFSCDCASFTGNMFYWIFDFKNKFGIEVLSNAIKFQDVSCRFSTYAGPRGVIVFNPRISMGSSFLFGFKVSHFIDSDIDSVWKIEPSFSSWVDFKLNENSLLTFSFSSRDFFYHPNFFAPVFAIEFTNCFESNIVLFSRIDVRSIDLLTISSFIDGYSIRLGVGYKF